MTEHGAILILFGALLLVGIAMDGIGRLTHLPRVTLLLIFGFVVGPEMLDLLPDEAEESFELITSVALTMVGFLLGGKLCRTGAFQNGRKVVGYSVVITVMTTGIVIARLILLGEASPLALTLGAIAAATAPAATLEVIRESGLNNRFTQMLEGIVAADDVWGLLIFSVVLAVVSVLTGNGSWEQSVLIGIRDIGGALLIGLGLPAVLLTGRLRPGEPTILEALGLVLLCAGLTAWLEASPFLAAMTLGVVIVNLASHHTRPFHVIEDFDRPFLVLFFVLAGTRLHLPGLIEVSLLGSTYAVLRMAGRFAGAWAGGACLHTPPHEHHHGPVPDASGGRGDGHGPGCGRALPGIRRDHRDRGHRHHRVLRTPGPHPRARRVEQGVKGWISLMP